MHHSIKLVLLKVLFLLCGTYGEELNAKGYVFLHATKYAGLPLTKRDDFPNLDVGFNYSCGIYMADLELGSQRDPVRVLIDTGSSDFWVPSSANGHCYDDTNTGDKEATCSAFGSFNPYLSTSFSWNETDFVMFYGDGTYVKGEWGTDDVFVHDVALGRMSVGVSDNSTKAIGILGLGLSQSEATTDLDPSYRYENFPEKLVSNRMIHRASYSVFLDQDGDAQLLFGAVDPSKYLGMLYQFPMVNGFLTEGASSINSISITLNSIGLVFGTSYVPVVTGFLGALLDTGTTFTSFPASIVSKIALEVDMAYDQETELYSVECSALDDTLMNFNFQGIDFAVPMSYFFYKISSGLDSAGPDICFFGSSVTYLQEYVVLGQAFLDSIYMTVDLEGKSVALAYANLLGPHNYSEKNIRVLETGIPGAVHPPSNLTYDLSHMVYSTATAAAAASTSFSNYPANYSAMNIKSMLTAHLVHSESPALSSSVTSFLNSESGSIAFNVTIVPSSRSRSAAYSFQQVGISLILLVAPFVFSALFVYDV